jgi:hypothetical protein
MLKISLFSPRNLKTRPHKAQWLDQCAVGLKIPHRPAAQLSCIKLDPTFEYSTGSTQILGECNNQTCTDDVLTLNLEQVAWQECCI